MAQTPVKAPVEPSAAAGELNVQQRAFAEHYAAHGNAKQAAIAAGYSEASAESQGSRLSRNRKVAAYVAALQAKRAAKHEITAERLDRELAAVAFLDWSTAVDAEGRLLPLHQMPEATRRALASIEVEELFEGHGEERVNVGRVHKVRGLDKLKAIELLARRFKEFSTRVDHTGEVTHTLTFAQLVNMAAEKARAAKGGGA